MWTIGNDRTFIMTIKITRDLAAPELLEYLDSVGIFTDTADMTEDDKADFEAIFTELVRPMMQGRAIIDGGEYVLTLHKPVGERKEIRITEPNGSGWSLMDRTKKGEDMKKLLRYAEDFTGLLVAEINKMANRDVKVITKFAQLFMA